MIRYVYILSLLVLGACSTQVNQQSDFMQMYNSSAHPIDKGYSIFHSDNIASELHFRIKSADLLYTRNSQSSPFIARYQIKFVILESDTRIVLDSGSRVFEDVREDKSNHLLQGSLQLKLPVGKSGDLKITLTDLNRRTEHPTILYIDKKSTMNRQFFLLTKANGAIIVDNVLDTEEEIQFASEFIKNDKLYMSYYSPKDNYPPAPFSRGATTWKPTIPDTVISLDFGGEMSMTFDKRGIYLFQTDTSKKEGFALLRFYDKFPKVSTGEMLAKPLKYITAKEEFEDILYADSPRSATENFWLDAAGNKDIARHLIKEYYGRVEEANTYFSSYIEGWRTDRGLVYIIYGPPYRVNKFGKWEYWYYGQESSSGTLTFTFRRVENKFSENVYELERSIAYKSSWYHAVETWRRGRAYNAR